MSSRPPRVALFTDSYHEVNGVALTCRKLDAFARRQNLPFFNCHAGVAVSRDEGLSAITYELKRGPFAFALEQDLWADPFLMRYVGRMRAEMERFKPDIIHITGPNDISLLGAYLAKKLRVPMTASWHTNVHEFAAWRTEKLLASLPAHRRSTASAWVERNVLWICTKLYGAARMCFAPNPELIEMLEAATGKPARLMQRGVDVDQFHPGRRRREDSAFVLGYVGRISAEKNVRFLARLEQGLLAQGKTNFRIVVVGHGGEQSWLEANLKHGEFPGVLKGDDLSRAYADFDLFVFPSFTDTYGNVVNEAMASGAPCIVTTGGGPKYLIEDGSSGVVAQNEEHFIQVVGEIMSDPARLARMRQAARQRAVETSWDRVFEKLFEQLGGVAEQYPAPWGRT